MNMGTLLSRFLTVLLHLLVLESTFCVNGQNVDEMGNLFEGDIAGLPTNTKSGMKDERFRWPGATVPYEFHGNYPPYLRQKFVRATQYISRNTCIRFVPHSSEADYIFVVAEDWCWSFVGRRGGSQKLSMPPVCQKLGTFVHELVHALGFHHEQSRTDRDEYVTIQWKNIENGAEGNFKSYSEREVSPFGVSYDYGSVMHYSRKAFSKNGKDTIVPKVEGVEIGQRERLSPGDIAKLNNMYCK